MCVYMCVIPRGQYLACKQCKIVLANNSQFSPEQPDEHCTDLNKYNITDMADSFVIYSELSCHNTFPGPSTGLFLSGCGVGFHEYIQQLLLASIHESDHKTQSNWSLQHAKVEILQT